MKLLSVDHDRLQAVRTDVLTTLAERSETLTPTQITATTLRALHRHHPQITLEDVLELRVLLDSTVSCETPPTEQVDTIIEAALTELTAWNTISTVSI